MRVGNEMVPDAVADDFCVAVKSLADHNVCAMAAKRGRPTGQRCESIQRCIGSAIVRVEYVVDNDDSDRGLTVL